MKQINVMGIPFEIINVTPDDLLKAYENDRHKADVHSLFKEDARDFSGLCDAHGQKIYLNLEITHEKRKKTLIHEFIEATFQENCIDLSQDVSHMIMQAMANALYLSKLCDHELEELLKTDPEDIEIKLDGDTAG